MESVAAVMFLGMMSILKYHLCFNKQKQKQNSVHIQTMKSALTYPQGEQMAPSFDSPQDLQYILDHLMEFLENSQYADHPETKI
jgi:hypothetical protein